MKKLFLILLTIIGTGFVSCSGSMNQEEQPSIVKTENTKPFIPAHKQHLYKDYSAHDELCQQLQGKNCANCLKGRDEILLVCGRKLTKI